MKMDFKIVLLMFSKGSLNQSSILGMFKKQMMYIC